MIGDPDIKETKRALKHMKVVHVININGFGGAEKLLLQLLPALNRRIGIHCIILMNRRTTDAGTYIGRELEAKGITVAFIPYDRIFNRGILRQLRERINKEGYSVIHSHLRHADIWLAILKKARRLRLPVVSTMHGYNDDYENRYGFAVTPFLYRSRYFYMTRWVFRQLDGFIHISGIVSSFFNQTGLVKGKRQEIIYHGYEAAPVQRAQDADNDRHPFSIAIPGRLLVRKGHEYALKALEIVLPKYPLAEIHIYGEGPERGRLEDWVLKNGLEEKVHFHGYVADLDVRLRRAGVVVIPSLWEGFGLVFLDAFNARTPVVAFDLPAANEIIQDGRNGLLAEPYSAASLATKIQMIFAGDDLGKHLVTNASSDLEDRFSMDRMTEKYIQFYQTLSNG